MAASRSASQREYAYQFGARIKRLRNELGLSLDDVGALITMSGANISKIERGLHGPPTDEVIAAFARALKTDEDDLMRIAGRGLSEDSFQERVLAQLEMLRDEQRSGFERIEAALAGLARD